MHYAARLGRKDVVQILVLGGANINARGNKDQKTAYELAVQWKFEEMAAHLKKIEGKAVQ